MQEDALLAVSTLVEVLGAGFLKYMDAFKGWLGMGLRNFEVLPVCSAAVGVTGDICRALNEKVRSSTSRYKVCMYGHASSFP